MIGIVFQASLLWALITIFTRLTNSSQSHTEMMIVLIGYFSVTIPLTLLIGDLLGPLLYIAYFIILFVLVDKVCGTVRANTIRICVWFFGISFLLNFTVRFLASG